VADDCVYDFLHDRTRRDEVRDPLDDAREVLHEDGHLRREFGELFGDRRDTLGKREQNRHADLLDECHGELDERRK
jgi:hypothetical protein